MESFNVMLLSYTIIIVVSALTYCGANYHFAQAVTELNSTIDDTNKTEFTTYQDDDLGFVIQYPIAWTVTTTDLIEGDVVIFRHENEVNTDVRIKLITPYVGQSLKDLGEKYMKNNYGDYKAIAYYRNSSTTLSGQPAIKGIGIFVPSSQDDKSATSKLLTVVTFSKNRNSFVEILYGADKPSFSKHLHLVERMIDSFKLFEPQKVIQEEN
jgi:hypothetical protein